MRLFFVVSLVLSGLCGFGQNGLPFMTDIELGRMYSDARINSIVQDSEENMFYSTSRGILRYDGSTWESISTPAPAIKLFHHEVSNRVFVGLKKGAMELVKSDSGTYRMLPIPGVDTKQPVPHIIDVNGELFFIGESHVFRYNPLVNQPAESFPYPETLISGAFANEGNLYLLFYQDGLFRWDAEKLEKVGQHARMADDLVLFSFETTEGTYVGFDSDRLYLFNRDRFSSVSSLLQEFLSDNLLSDGLKLNDTLMALSTLAGGTVVANIKNNDIHYRFDYTTGAKDNEIFSLGIDRYNGLWLSYEAGLTRVDLLQPVRSFSGYPGLDGNLTASIMVNGTFYVGTGNGVFVLKKATSKDEMKRMMDEMMRKKHEAEEQQTATYVPPQSQTSVAQNKESATLVERFKENPEEVKEELSKKEMRELKREIRKQRRDERKGKSVSEVIDDIFTGNDKEEPEPTPEEPEEKPSGPDPMKGLIPNPTTGPAGSGMTAPPGSSGGQRSKPQVLQKESQAKKQEEAQQKLKELRNSYLYKKIAGVDVKCRQLISLNDQVFAATNNGLYLIDGERSTNLTPGIYINQVITSSDKTKLLIASLNGVHELKKDASGKWASRKLNDTIQFVAYNVIEDEHGSIWAGTDNGAYRYFLGEVKFYPLPNVMNERVLVTNVYGKVHFLLPTSLYHYLPDSDTILPATLPEVHFSGQMEYLLGNDGLIWINSSIGWNILNGEAYAPLLPFLDLFEDIRHIATDDQGNIYVIDKGQGVFSVESRQAGSGNKFNVYIRQVMDSNGQTFSLERTKIQTNGGALTFNVAAPFYLKSQGTQYQWRIAGVQNNWTKWDTETEITPGIVPPGDYVLEVRARNILGEVSEVKTLAFTVPQRLLLRWYFILLYVLILTAIVFGIIKWRERSLKETQRILEQEVARRTSELEQEKVKTEALLLNILPRDTAEELQMNGRATARHYNQVSVLFTDFKGFTQFAESTKPQDLVDELHRYFVRFDEIIGKYYLEKIKTIGDAYMCAGGVPIRNSSNAIAITLAALEIRDFMTDIGEEKLARNEQALEIRIGIHTGPLTAGVVGLKKFAYDIWGDTVNTASRMESSSEPGRVNVSGTTHELIKKYFVTEYRGQKEAKGKGLVEMYFVNGIKPEFSENGEGKIPNKGLWELIS